MNKYKKSRIKCVVAMTFSLVLLQGCGGDSEPTDPTPVEGTQNTVPVAKSGADQTINLGAQTTLSGEFSEDSDGDVLTFTWQLTSQPSISTYQISNPNDASFVFIPDVVGDYTFSLVVNDSQADSAADTVVITVVAPAENQAPTANAGEDKPVELGQTAQLSASLSSDPDGDPMSYQWQLISKPADSNVVLGETTSVNVSFTPDVIGTFVLSLMVADAELSSELDEVSVVVTEPVTGSNADFYTPESISLALSRSRTVDWTLMSENVTDLTRFVLNSELSVGIDEIDGEVNTDLHLSEAITNNQSATDGELLRHMLQAVEIEPDLYRIMSVKHSNYAVDYDSEHGHLVWRDIRGVGRTNSDSGFILFHFEQDNDVNITAQKRYVYQPSADDYTAADGWTARYLAKSGDMLVLADAASPFVLYQAPIDFTIPFDFNPEFTARAVNPEVTPQSKEDKVSKTAGKIVAAYSAQVAEAGNDPETLSAASTMLDQIDADLAAQGSALRYPKAFYLAFREGLFARSITSMDATDPTLGQLTVPYVYFTNSTDAQGVLHPFMVIASYGLPDSLALLWDVPTPPGDGNSQEYSNQNVTRSYHKEAFLMKIPLKDYGIVSSLTENNMENDLASDVGESAFDHHNYASISATGVAIDGVIIYPSYNNTLHVAQSAAELSAHGMHAGRGLGVHYHADAHSATEEGLNLYNWHDYEGHSHPPIISIGFDGVAGYGIYNEDDITSDGVSIPLDEFGGHSHGDYGYHYHSQRQIDETPAGKGPNDPPGGTSYTKHLLPPYGAWAGKINDIPEFWDGTAPNLVGGDSVYLGTK